ncbi:MAG: hypothetical protein NUW01_08895 [Gemmatimonadaceae bacterium]|nr:hypothetical protein [Gemmatimonadaceae bacterium]
MPDPFDDATIDEILLQVSVADDEASRRHNKIKEWRDLRYGRDDVLNTIPVELRATDFEYHSPELDRAIAELTSFLSASIPVWMVDPAHTRDKSKADDIEAVLDAVFGRNGVLETESGGEVSYSVWENQVENGEGIYKFTMKRDYPLSIPQRRYADEYADQDSRDATELEDNPEYNPRSRKESREGKKQSRYRERTGSLDARRKEFSEKEFPFQWRVVDPRTHFVKTVDGVPVLEGEITKRQATILKDHGLEELTDRSKGFVFLEEAKPADDAQSSSQTPMVTCFEAWTRTKGYFGFCAAGKSNGKRDIRLSAHKQHRSWTHPYGRTPYYHAYGLPSTDSDAAYRYTGAFMSMVAEMPLLNHLETMHFNSVQRGHFPMYYPVKDPAFKGQTPPMDVEQLIGVSHTDMERTELPPGYRWEVMPSGFEPDLNKQLDSVRQRVMQSAIREVLSGISAASGESAAHLALKIDAAQRAMSPFVRHHEAPRKEMAQCMLSTAKKLRIDLHVTATEQKPDGTRLTKPLVLKASDIVSTSVNVQLKTELPVDAAANETRAMSLIQSGMRSYETIAPELLGVGDPVREKVRIRLEQRQVQIDDIAFNAAAFRFAQNEPAEFANFMQNVQPVAPPSGTVGGGPNGTLGGATALMGRGEAKSPNAAQVDGGGY